VRRPSIKRSLAAAIAGLVLIPGAASAAGFHPGDHSLGDGFFPQIGNGGYDALNYAIDLNYDPDANYFRKGTRTTIDATATQDLSSFTLDFQGLAVTRVTVDGVRAGFKQMDATPRFSKDPKVTQPMKLLVKPAKGIPEGDQFEVRVDYHGRPRAVVDADESLEGWVPACSKPRTCDGSFVVNEPIGAQSWFPSNNYMSDKATFKTTITTTSNRVALGAGELASKRKHSNGTTTWTWIEQHPTATYLTSATVGRFDFAEASLTTADGRTLPVYTAIDSAGSGKQKQTLEAQAARIPEITDFLTGILGPYPFDSTGFVADWVPSVGYALENETKPHFAGSKKGPGTSTTDLAHELTHQWMGDSISPATWHQIWFNEGWATIAEVLFDYRLDGAEMSPRQFFDKVYEAPADAWTLAPAVLDDDPANLFAGFPVYNRSGAMLEGLREIVGDDRFGALARQLQSDYGYATITEDQFVTTAQAASGLDAAGQAKLGEYFHQWLYSTSRPSLTPADFTGAG
jgi:aminopeptidase N